MNRAAAISIAALAIAALAGCASAQCSMVTMRDGVQLSTCVSGANPSSPRTAVLDRSPYGHLGIELLADIFLLFGFVAVGQDMRGTGFSQGNFSMWHSDGTDAYDTMEWIAQQPWSNGQVYTIGASADGIASFMQIAEAPQWLRAQFIIFATSVAYPTIYPGGAFRMELAEKWLNGTVPAQAPFDIELVIQHETPGPYWDQVDVSADYGSVDFPSVMWAGWYDIFLQGNLIGYDGYQNQASPDWRGRSKIVIDPLGHCQKASSWFPNHLIEGRAILPLLLAIDMYKNVSTPAENAQAVTFYVMGANQAGASGNYWTSLPDWPAFKPTPFYLAPNGALDTEPPSSANNMSFVYDPANPVPTLGGNNLFLPCGPADLSPVESRPDVLTFTTAALASDVWVTGPLDATLFVSSNATDTDFVAFLTDVYPSGQSVLIQDGIVRMRWRSHQRLGKPQPMVPGEVYAAQVSLWNTSYVFPAGHRIRVDITSSNYPRFSANPNNCLFLNQTGPTYVAQNTIHISPEFPSQITLPLVSPSQLPPVGVLSGSDDPAVQRAAASLEKYIAQRGQPPKSRAAAASEW